MNVGQVLRNPSGLGRHGLGIKIGRLLDAQAQLADARRSWIEFTKPWRAVSIFGSSTTRSY